MELYKMISNISGKDNEKELIEAISSVRKKFQNIDEERMCRVYSGYLLDELHQRHVPCRLVNTKDIGLTYEHEFVLVANDEANGDYFIADLTFSQFKSELDYFQKLLIDGYQSIDREGLNCYLKIISKNTIKNSFSLDYMFFMSNFMNSGKSSSRK